MIGKNTKIEEIVKMDNTMMEFFNGQKIDYCCNGNKTIEEVAKEKSIDPDDLLKVIIDHIDLSKDEKEVDANLDDFRVLDIEEMIDSIIKDHHQKERDLLFEIDPLLNKIMLVHYDHHGQDLLRLHSLFADLKKELEEHFVKEEKITFPLMIANPNPSEEMIKMIEELETDHEKAGNIIKEMINLTDWFKVPEDGCNTYKYTFDKLTELIKDVFTHIFKENSILFVKYTESEEK